VSLFRGIPNALQMSAVSHTDPYIAYCESLWQSWLAGRLEIPAAIARMFDLNAAPEPYLSFEVGENPLVALTTNPGATMAHQVRGAVLEGGGPVSADQTYASAAQTLASFYERELSGVARRRIVALRSLSQWAGYAGVLQVEASPFHSPRLPGKEALVDAIAAGGLLAAYIQPASAFLAPKPVVVVSAVSTRVPLRAGIGLPRWVRWMSELAGLSLERATFTPLVKKGSLTTSAVLVSRTHGVPKALVLMMGGNHLPAEGGLRVLASMIR
jgi:hypothetical protein